VHGGLRPASDLDFLAVVARGLSDGERRTITDRLLGLSGPTNGGRHLEVTAVVRGPWRFPPLADYQYGDWLRDEIAAHGPPRPAPMPNLAVEITQVLAANRTLAGPPPADLLDPVPRADLVRAGIDGIPGLLDDLAEDTRNVVLTLARIWLTTATGSVLSKDEAAAWAVRRLAAEHRPVLEHARHLYLTTTYADETWPSDLRTRVRPHVDAVLREIARGG
jgi:streptomycin 3"-adenylyltransferase